MSDPILFTRDLWVRVQDTGGRGSPIAVVRGANLELQRGAVTCLVGESGSGKTVLMRALLGISGARPGVTAGTAWARPDGAEFPVPLVGPRKRWGGRALPSLRPGWAGYVFQHPSHSLDPLLRVSEQVGASVMIAHSGLTPSAVQRRVLAWLERVHLPNPEAVAQLYPHELSGGMAQRVAIAIALATEPDLLVADEPTTGLDWSVRRDIVDLLDELCRARGMSLLLISHDFQVVEHIADQLYIMFRGELVEDGPRSAFFEPGPGAHPYTRELQARSKALEEGSSPPRLHVAEQPTGAGAGCCYAHRCPWIREPSPERSSLGERCRTVRPPDFRPTSDHRVRCIAVGEPT